MRAGEVYDELEPHLLRKRAAMLGFAVHLTERVARREHVAVQVVAAVHRKSKVTDLVRRLFAGRMYPLTLHGLDQAMRELTR